MDPPSNVLSAPKREFLSSLCLCVGQPDGTLHERTSTPKSKIIGCIISHP